MSLSAGQVESVLEAAVAEIEVPGVSLAVFDDGTMIEAADNPRIQITVSPELNEWDAPPGTEIWVLRRSE